MQYTDTGYQPQLRYTDTGYLFSQVSGFRILYRMRILDTLKQTPESLDTHTRSRFHQPVPLLTVEVNKPGDQISGHIPHVYDN